MLVACLFLTACPRAAQAPTPGPSTNAPTAPITAAISPDAGAPVKTSVLHGIEITSLGGGRLEITGTAKVRLAPVARVERRTNEGTFAEVANLDAGGGYRLRASCDAPASNAPVSLVHGETLRPVPWTGFDCSAQCITSCRANVFLGPGTFRVVVKEDGGAELASPTFVMPDAEHTSAPALERWAIAEGITRVTATRAAFPPGTWELRTPERTDRVAGLLPREPQEKQRVLGPDEVAEIAARLRDAKGFDDRVQKRCLMKTMVGFRVTRSLPSTGAAREETTDVVVDFACQKLFAVHGEGDTRTVHATHFDPSRAAFLALVRRALPDDAELAATK